MDKIKILFLCTGNSCRSQMAEALAANCLGFLVEPASAGSTPHGIDSRAVTVMAEIGIDISRNRSKPIGEFAGREFDYVITLCASAAEQCPVFPGRAKRLHVAFDDPPKLALEAATEEEALRHYRRVRDEIAVFVRSLADLIRDRK